MSQVFRIPGRVVTGWGSFDDLGRLGAPLGRKALLVTGRKAMKATGITDRSLKLLKSADVRARVFDEVEREPDVTTVDRGREAARRFGADCVIGLGGGSAMDVGKVVAGLFNEGAPTAEFHAGRRVDSAGLPFVAVPTTSGTGSEVTINGVISDHRRKVKLSIRDERFMARVALVDPQLTVPCPPRVTATAGMDALSQAVESYASLHANAVTEALSVRAVVELATSLATAVADPSDRTARTRAAGGSLLAGMALGNARLGVIHGIVHPLGVRYEIPHGLACGVLLPVALQYNREAMGKKYDVLAHILGGDPAEFCAELLQHVGLPSNLRDYAVKPEDFETIAAESLPSGSLKANPRTVTREDVIAILRQLC